ncbi:aldo/keto reductase [uncultured Azohydromonas sp.]|jgi:Aldo/keto reductases, related to diketogulonate reductase|uniref:aldo/keto reductase n=1 Tax=uncultured Azohydromonas sp. TaxID=487342 RepID=UPI002634130B|nr:aldo/keto reductase [uncultured Azohydromonas sp.]
MRTVTLPNGTALPALGLGTWHTGESQRSRAAEVKAVRLAIELGVRLFDTAEMYGEGGAEEMLGQALAEALRAGDVRREELTIVSKVYPHNASLKGLPQACERSLQRLGLERIDLYLLHWPGSHPLRDTVAAFEALQARGRITHWGVSNFDTDDMKALWRVPGGEACAVNQVYYSLSQRGIEFDLVPWQRARRVPLMAYCPIDQGALALEPELKPLAQRVGATPAQLALAWLLQRGDVIAIPKAVRESHLLENVAAATIELDAATLAALDALFPPPQGKEALAIV